MQTHWHFVAFPVVALAICRHPVLGGETRSGSFRGGVCVAAHPSFSCFVLSLLLSLALYSSCNHSEKN